LRIGRLLDVLRAEIERWELPGRIYERSNCPWSRCSAAWRDGVSASTSLLRTIAEEFAIEAKSLEAEIQKVAGHEFKVNSPQQLQTVLFDELGLTAVKKIKSGYSTDAGSLEAIAGASTPSSR
jgi:DNA polymerase I-like protein with 3'-5' exonuclease and polymerase domains